jgi:hypothetical protein
MKNDCPKVLYFIAAGVAWIVGQFGIWFLLGMAAYFLWIVGKP